MTYTKWIVVVAGVLAAACAESRHAREKRDPLVAPDSPTESRPAPPPPSPTPSPPAPPPAPPPDPAKWVRINPGTFEMGSRASELFRIEDETPHEVTLTRGYWLKVTEVTQGEWTALIGSNPSVHKACGASCPVENVTWYDAVAYCNALSKNEGLERCYVAGDKEYDASSAVAKITPSWPKTLDCVGYRLPTEAEWEYAARAGTTTAYYTGANTQIHCDMDANLDKAGWYCGNDGGTAHPVKQKAPNAWGLYDMLGNVSEWVWDWLDEYGTGPRRDPLGPAEGYFRGVRTGGSYARGCRAATRGFQGPGDRGVTLGFRPARSIP